jgi:ribonuclease HI
MLKESRPTVSMSMRRREKWRKPPSDVLELNCDASFLPRSSSGSWGFLIRDNAGDVVVTGRGKVDRLLSAFHAELVACLQGIQATVDLGIGHLIVETDAKMVVQAIKTNDFNDAAVGLLVTEIKNLVSS